MPLEPADGRAGTQCLDDDVGGQNRAVSELHRRDVLVALERRHPRRQVEPHAAFLVPPLQLGRQHGPERADHRHRVDGHRVDLAAESPGRRRDLAADETGAEHDHARSGDQRRAQGEGVVEGADDVPARLRPRRRARDGEAAGGHAGRGDERVVLEAVAVRELDPARAQVGPLDALPSRHSTSAAALRTR